MTGSQADGQTELQSGALAEATIDRHTPTIRPEGKPSGYQRWRDLLFLHWSTDPERLSALLPEGLELDLFEGEALVGVVPFMMRGVRPRWAPEWSAFNFLETNLRVYVTCQGEPGVYFFSLEAASRVAVWAARIGWSLPYYYARMESARDGDVISYETRRPRSPHPELAVRYEVGEALPPASPESLEFFVLERYLLFTERGGRLYRGQVYHTPYPAHRCEVLSVAQGLTDHIGLPLNEEVPRFAHYSPGVDVEVFDLVPVEV